MTYAYVTVKLITTMSFNSSLVVILFSGISVLGLPNVAKHWKYYTSSRLTAFVQDYPDKPVPER